MIGLRLRILAALGRWRSRRFARAPIPDQLASQKLPPPWKPPPAGRRHESFQPRLYDLGKLTGYIRYTDQYAAEAEVLKHLAMLPEGRLQWEVCGFSTGYLEALLGKPVDDTGAAVALPAWVEEIAYFDWLETVQAASHDNANPHSELLLAGFSAVGRKLAEGRSVALQRDALMLNWRFLDLPKEEADARREEHAAYRDIAPAEADLVLTDARRAGRTFGLAHRAAEAGPSAG